MPVFEYIALDARGKNAKGSLDAESVRVARQKLRAQGLFPTELTEARGVVAKESRDIKKYLTTSTRVSLNEVAISTRQLATLVGASLPLVSALSALSDQTSSVALKRVFVELRERVEEGESLARSLANFPKIFPRLYVNMVASGEASGTLDNVLANLADYLESQIELRRKVRSALTYPSLMLVICTLVISGLLMFVVPQIVAIFQKQGRVLPFPTRVVIGISDFLIAYWYFVLPFLLSIPLLIRMYYAQPKGRQRIDWLLLKLPIFGQIYLKIATARVAKTLGALLASGVGLLEALEIAKGIINNSHLSKALEDARDGVREGRSLAKELSKSGLFPSMLSHMIAVGEKSGELENMLTKAGKSYETEVSSTLSALTTILEPVMMIVVGSMVLVIVLAILLPIADMIDMMQPH